MSVEKFNIGDKVSFRGSKKEDGRLLAAHVDGRDVFHASIAGKPYGLCYALIWPDGSPVGLPFHDFQLTKE